MRRGAWRSGDAWASLAARGRSVLTTRTKQIWRPVTAVFYSGSFSFHFLLMCVFLYQYSNMLETSLFANRRADYVWMLILFWLATLLVSIWYPLDRLGGPIIFACIYVWSQTSGDAVVNFWFGIRVRVRRRACRRLHGPARDTG